MFTQNEYNTLATLMPIKKDYRIYKYNKDNVDISCFIYKNIYELHYVNYDYDEDDQDYHYKMGFDTFNDLVQHITKILKK